MDDKKNPGAEGAPFEPVDESTKDAGETPEAASFTVPIDALKNENGTEPAEGDEVEFTGTGRVTRAADGTATVILLTVNGEKPSEDESEDEAEAGTAAGSEDDKELADLRKAAKAEDAKQGLV